MTNFSSLKGLISTGYGELIGTIFSALFWFLLARELNPETYGEIHFFIGIASIAGFFATIGTSNTLTVYTAKQIPIQSTLTFISLIAGVFSFVVLFVLYDRFDLGLLVFGYVINFTGIGYLLGSKNYSRYSKFVLLQKFLTLALGFLFYYVLGPEGIIYALALTYGPFLIILVHNFKTKINFSLLRPRLNFISGNYALQLVAGLAGNVDKIIVAPILGYAVLGHYSLGLVIVSVMMMFPNIVFKYLLPQESTGSSTTQIKKISILFSIFVGSMGVVLFPYLIPIFLPQYIPAIILIQIMAFAVVPQSIASIHDAKLLGMEKSYYVFLGNLVTLVSLTISLLILGLLMGPVGLAVAYLLSISIRALFLTFLTSKKILSK